MKRLCDWLDTHRAELVADFRSIYHLNVLDALHGHLEVAYALELISGLMSEPGSRFRACWLSENPSDGERTDLGFLGWSQDSSILIAIHNMIAAGHGKQSLKSMLDGPKAQARSPLFAPTIADFDTDRFMSVIAGRARPTS